MLQGDSVAASAGMLTATDEADALEVLHRSSCTDGCQHTRPDCSLNTGFIPVGDDADIIPAVRRPDDIVLFVAGGTGLYSAVFPSWAAGAHRNAVVHEVVATGAACELPWVSGARR